MIHLLDDVTINQIAAGEVVNAPFSVVKELIENAIDAQSDTIILEIKEGGKQLIRVTDNGVGIPEDQVPTAFLRHATSKINTLEDLERALTLGFRGEALASIAAVSQLEIITRPANQAYGISLQLAGGKVVQQKQVGCPIGTSIIVKNLFYNTPARLKFIKSTASETGKISEIMARLALSKPQIAFKYINNNNIMFTTSGNSDLSQAILSVLDRALYQHLIQTHYQSEAYKLTGYIGQPTYVRGNRSYGIIFVNGRYVKSTLLSQSIEAGYSERLPINKFPVYILNLELDPLQLDVNVHPTKTEVKFHQEEAVKTFIQQCIKTSLNEEISIPQIKVEASLKIDTPTSKPAAESFVIQGVKEAGSTYETPVLAKEQSPFAGVNAPIPMPEADQPAEPDRPAEADRPVLDAAATSNRGAMLQQALKAYAGEQESFMKKSTDSTPQADTPQVKQKNLVGQLLTDATIIGQLFNTYILLEKDQGLFLIDQHAAHERLLYNQFKAAYLQSSPLIQQLVTPSVMTLAAEDYEIIMEYLADFNSLGFEIESFGQNTVIIRGVPMVLGIPRNFNFFLDTIDEFKSGFDKQKPFYEQLIQKSCKEAIKGKDRLSHPEMMGLLQELSQLEPPLTCPHGRPIVLIISRHELEKYFKRIQ